MRGQLGHDTRPHAQLAPSFLCMDTWVTSQLNVAFIRRLRGSSNMCLAYFLTCYPWVIVQPGTSRCPVDWCRKLMSALYVCVCMYVYKKDMYVFVSVCLYIKFIYLCMLLCMYVCICVYVCMFVCTYVCTYMHICYCKCLSKTRPLD